MTSNEEFDNTKLFFSAWKQNSYCYHNNPKLYEKLKIKFLLEPKIRLYSLWINFFNQKGLSWIASRSLKDWKWSYLGIFKDINLQSRKMKILEAWMYFGLRGDIFFSYQSEAVRKSNFQITQTIHVEVWWQWGLF